MRKGDLCAKLVINSHVKYHRALIYALRSLYEIGFDEWEDVVVVLGGCDGEDEHEPQHQVMPLSAKVMVKCITIRTSQDNYDFHGYNMLHTYKNHPLICADMYFYFLDTIEFLPEFNHVWCNLPFWDSEHNVFAHRLPSCNQVCFMKEVIDIYGDMYSFNEGKSLMTKNNAIQIEFADKCFVGGRRILNITKMKNVSTKWFKSGKSRTSNCVDPYGLGKKRGWIIFPAFGIKKFIRHGTGSPAIKPDFNVGGRY